MRIVTLLSATVLAGCIGDLPPPGPGPGPGPVNDQPDAGSPRPVDAPPALDAATLLKNWSGCMTLANFQTAKMANAWGTLITSTAKECSNCHQDGAYSFIATTDETKFYTQLSTHSYFLAMYFSADVANQKVIVNTTSFKAANDSTGHPPFNYTTNAGLDALNLFYTSTAANTACGAPTLVD